MALYWTVSGPVDVHYGREWSLFDWSDRCAEAAKAGFRGIGLWHADVEHQLRTRTLREMRAIFDDAGLQYLEVEFLADFFVDRGEPARAASDRLRSQLFATAAAFDAHHIKVGNIPGTPCEFGRLTEEFAALCGDAAEHTDAKVAYELMPFDVNVNTLEAAVELAVSAGARNGGLAIDTWHMGKLGIAPGDLGRIPPNSSFGSSCRTDSRNRWRTPSTRRSTTGDCRARASSTSPVTSGPYRISDIRGRGALRCCRHTCAACRSRRSSGAPMRRRSRSFARVSREGREMTEPDGDRLIWMYGQMLRIREFEERVKRTFTEHPGVIRGHTHLADGAEASIVGALSTFTDDDQLLATYRCHGYPLVLGTDPRAMMAEIYGRTDGLCGGYGGSMHLLDPARGFLGTSGIVGQGIPLATGAAYAAQIRKRRQVVFSFFGDGASKQGAFAESLNIASLWKLPIVYVMENNSYNVVTRVEQEDANAAAGEPLAIKAQAFSMPGVTVDGGDPVAVHDTVGAAVARARSGEGPTLVESKIYRLSAHGNIIAPPGVPLHFPEHEAIEVFGAREEYEAALRGDPLPRFRARLVTDGKLSVGDADRIAGEVRDEMEAAVQFGLDSPFPEAHRAVDHVYA